MSRRAWAMAVLLVLALPLAAVAQGQTGRIAGALSDVTGAMLPGATVTIKSATGVVRTAVTDSEGRYVFADVAPGTYEITFELPGFKTLTSKAVVAPGQAVNLETKLEIGLQAEAVQVTGTLIPRPTLEAMSPVTTLDVEELTYRGLTRMEDLLISLPQVFAAQNSTIANGATGTATVDLRYLGPQRTLVLLDGRRMAAGDAQTEAGNAPDLNFIPSALVKRVDVLTGGASSVYGADAVAGVVNFVLDTSFSGVRGGFQIGGYQHNNDNAIAAAMNTDAGFTYPQGSTWNAAPSDWNVALGGRFADNKGHGAVYLDYRYTSAINKDQRDYTNCSPAQGDDGPICGGSSTWQYGRFIATSADGESTINYVLDANSPNGDQFRLRRSTDVYNYAPANFMQRPDERWAGGGFLNYDWNKHVGAYARVMYMDDYTDAQIAPSGDFANTSQINCDNPMLSDQQRRLICTDMGYGPTDIADVIVMRRNVEGGGRVAQIRHTSLLISGGVKGEINDVWSYDGYGLQAEMHSPQSYANDLNINNIQNALIVDGTPGDSSTWVCRSGDNCVPWNIFRVGGVTQEALDYLQLPMVLDSGTRTRLVNGTLTADLKGYNWAFPTATEGIKLAVGGEYRTEYLQVNPDLAYRLAWGAGQGGPTLPVEGDYDVREFFVEGLLPLVQDARGAKDLSLELGYRYSDYSNTGGWPTYKVQASWAPATALKFRAGYNRATRSPNIVELYTPQGLGLNGSTDICAGPSPTATSEQCARTGVPASYYGRVLENPAEQYNTFDGGNPELEPEIANTYTAGVVVAPSGSGLTATLDYFNIRIDDTIGSLNADDVVQQCAETGNPVLCNLIHRDRLYTLWLTTDAYTTTTNRNIGKRWSEGLDLTVGYVRSLGDMGSFTANLIASYIFSQKIDTGLYNYECVTYFGEQCGIPVPTWRHLARFSWQAPFKTTFSLGWRLIGPVTNDDGSPNPAIGDPDNVELLRINDIYEIPTYNYFDVSAAYQLTKHYQIVGGVNNIFDKEPPLAPGMQDNDYGTGFYGTYDPLGRYFFTGIQVTF